MKKIGDKKKYKCSNGERVSQEEINERLKDLRLKMFNENSFHCEAYPHLKANDHDHTISQSRCKILGKSELIWDRQNVVRSSRVAHQEWESYKSGIFEDHANCIQRMKFIKKHDIEGFEKRFSNMSNFLTMKILREYEP